jgi:hypothetical protein
MIKVLITTLQIIHLQLMIIFTFIKTFDYRDSILSQMAESELTQWNNANVVIVTDGIDVATFNTLDF